MSRNLDDKNITKIKKIIDKIQEDIDKIYTILEISDTKIDDKSGIDTRNAAQYLEGIFDGRFMKASNDEDYLVPENYASKSKLVTGDRLKLVFAPDGKYIFKQIEAVARLRKIGILSRIGQNYKVQIEDKEYNVLKASVTYYKLRPGSKVAVALPENIETNWATIENKII